MPEISALKPQKNGKRVNVYLDGKFGFGIDLENFVTLGLKTGQEYSTKEIRGIIKKAEWQKTWDKLLKFATLRPRSEKEINDYIKRKKIHASLQPALLKKLKLLKLLNDLEFAKWWVEQRLQFKSKSKRDLSYELRTKGINKEIIEEVLGGAKIDEAKIAKELLAKKAYKWQDLPSREARQKKAQYLAGKGFSWDVIGKVVGEVVE